MVSKDVERAVRYYKEAALNGFADAQANYGLSLSLSLSLWNTRTHTHTLSLSCFLPSLLHYHSYIAYCLQHGIGTPIDLKESIKMYEKAAAQKQRDAITNLGLCYEEGIGVCVCM